MAQTFAEKRAALEARIAKLSTSDVAAKIAETKAKLEAEVAALATYKDYEGKLATWDVHGDGKVKVKVLINGFQRKAFKRELFNVSPIEGEGSVNVSLDKLAIDGSPTTPPVAPTA